MSTTPPRPEPRADTPPGVVDEAASGGGGQRDAQRPLGGASPASGVAGLRTGRLLSHLLVLLAGLGVTIWGAVRLTHRTIKCHGVVMHPGDSCRTSSFSQLNGDKLMSYELLRRQAEISQPFVIGAGLLLAAFGALLVWQELRRAR